jgi:glucose/arabinose dehydrogenase
LTHRFQIILTLLPVLWFGLNLPAHSESSTPSDCTDLSGIAATPLVDFESKIQPLLDACTSCHGDGGAAGLDLRPGQSYANLVEVFAATASSRMRAEPFNADESVLLLAVNCEQPGGPGFQMPGMEDANDRALVRFWINQGAWPAPTEPAIPEDVELTEVHPSGTFPGALGLVHAGDGSGRIFVIRQSGVIEAIDENGVNSTFMDISSHLTSGGERGLLGLAFHPDFAENDRFFVNYTASSSHPSGAALGDTVISEFTVDGSGIGDPESERVLMTIVQDFGNHNGGNIKFGPDGYLYIGMGDGGSGGDPCNRAQTLDPDNIQTGGNCKDDPSAALLGKMLRIDVDNTTPIGSNNLCAANEDGSAEYAIPADNPWAEDDAICAETWSYGLRNPWRWSFDRLTGDLWIADVGQSHWEEINLEPAGHFGGTDYGWKLCEGSYTYPAESPPEQCKHDHLFPVLEYPNTGFFGDCSVTGGYRYRGPVSSLRGVYIYGDYCSGKIWFGFQVGPNEFEQLEFNHGQSLGDLRSFGEDEIGQVYVVDGGGIWRLDGSDRIFSDRFENPENP